MWNFLMPALIGAGIGGGVNLLRGKNPLKGALVGGASGGLLSKASNMLPGAIVNGIGTNALAGGDIGKGLAINASALLGSSGIPASQVGKEVALNSIADMGLKQVGETFYNPEYFLGLNQGIPLYTGGQGLLSNAYDMASAAIPEELKNQITPQNMYGVASLLQQQSQAPRISGGGGGVQSGGAVKYEPLSTVSIPTRTRRKIG